MEIDKNKIPSPLKAPDGYFEDFDQRVWNQITSKPASNKPFTVSKNRIPVAEYIAVAATLAAILVTSWLVFFQTPGIQTKEPIPVVSSTMPETVPFHSTVADSILAEVRSTQIVEDMISEPYMVSPVGVASESLAMNQSDAAIAQELEDAGIIVRDANDGLFDAFEL